MLRAGGKEHAEGAFYVWTKEEIRNALDGNVGRVSSPGEPSYPRGEGTPPTRDSTFFCSHSGVQDGGNVAHDPQGEFTGKNILMQRQSLALTAREFSLWIEPAGAKLLAGLEILREVRAKRPRPHLDDKIITAWNGLMISALAKGAQVLGEPSHLAAATRAAEFIERELHDAATGTLYRSWREGRSNIEGFAEDYAYLVQGLLDLYEAGGEIRWLQWAEKLQARMDALFWDEAGGAYFNSRADDAAVIVRLKEDYDGAEPAPNSVAAMNLVRLDWMLGLPGAREKALRTVTALRPQWSRAAHALPQMLCALELVLAEPRTVVVAGDPAMVEHRALVAVLHERLEPRRVLLYADGAAGQHWLAARRPYLAEMQPRAGRATAYVCENFTCRAPAGSPDELRGQLAK